MAGGRVVDVSDRRPLGGVTVVMRNVANDAAEQTVSDSAGWFTLFPRGAGRYVLVFRRGLDFLVYPDTIALSPDSVFEKMFVIGFPPPEGLAGRDGPSSPVVPLAAFKARYPADLRQRGVEGSVTVQFVVDTSGRADMRTFTVTRSSDHLFSQAVRESVSSARFRPATRGGAKVRRLVNRTFNFCISRHRTAVGSDPRPAFSDVECDLSRR